MRRSTAVGQVVGFVDEADDFHRRVSDLVDVRLSEMLVGGAILEDAERIDTYDVVLVLDRPTRSHGWRCIPAENGSATGCA